MKNNNYINIQGFMLSELKLKGNELLIYAIIYGFSQDGENTFYGSLSYIEEMLDISKNGVRNVLKSLISKNLIIMESQSHYKVSKIAISKSDTKEYQKVIQVVAKSDTLGVSKSDTNIYNTNNKDNNTKNNFDLFWGSYPKRRVDKDKCLAKFSKLPEEIQKVVIEDVSKRKYEDNKWIKGFIPMTTTYLNNKKWEDDYEKLDQVLSA